MQSILDALKTEFSLTPVMAGEIECYIAFPEVTQESVDAFFGPLVERWKAQQLPLLRVEKERGGLQFELVTSVATPALLVEALQTFRRDIEQQAAAQNMPSSFAAKPMVGEPSSGMHLHLHLADAEGVNAYHKTEEWTSDALRWSLGGLLKKLEDDLPIFFPNPRDYARLNDSDHVPKIAGWGVNNRYCALRIPMTDDPYDKRIEHRTPCANASPEATVNAMLSAVLEGLRQRIEPPEQVHGKPTIGLLESL